MSRKTWEVASLAYCGVDVGLSSSFFEGLAEWPYTCLYLVNLGLVKKVAVYTMIHHVALREVERHG